VRHQEAEKLIGDRNGFGQNTENHNFIKRRYFLRSSSWETHQGYIFNEAKAKQELTKMRMKLRERICRYNALNHKEPRFCRFGPLTASWDSI
jgi:hypothetical protein